MIVEIKRENNYAFIDTQNIVRGVIRLGWFIDWNRFYIYLKEKYNVKEVYEFDGKIKGNIDVELAMQVFIEMDSFDKAVIVSGDGDFQSLVKYLDTKNKFKISIATTADECSVIIKKVTRGRMGFINTMRKKIGVIEIK